MPTGCAKYIAMDMPLFKQKNVMCIFTHGLNKKSILMFIDCNCHGHTQGDNVFKFNNEVWSVASVRWVDYLGH